MNTPAISYLINKFSSDIDDTFHYKFSIVNNADYEMEIIYKSKTKVLTSLFNQAGMQLSRMNNRFAKLSAVSNLNNTEFDIPKEWNNRVHTAIYKNIKKVSHQELEPDGIMIMRSSVEKCTFINIDGELTIKVKVVGQYAKI